MPSMVIANCGLAPILKRYLVIFREDMQQAIKSEHMPPRYSAKARSEAFGTKLAVLKRQMYAGRPH